MFSAEQNSSVYAHFCCFYLKTKQDYHLKADTENCLRQKEIVVLMRILQDTFAAFEPVKKSVV